MVMVFTGNGKGKTTASLGQALRALGQGRRVFMFQFIKSRKFPTGEDKMVSTLGNRFHFMKGGNGFVGILGDTLPWESHVKAAVQTLRNAEKVAKSRRCDLLILDEVNVALHLGLIPLKRVRSLIARFRKSGTRDLILTGRYAHKDTIRDADLVTECKEIKHPFQKGVRAARGREY